VHRQKGTPAFRVARELGESEASGLPSPQSRVPKLCPAPAFLAVLAVVAGRGMSNLQIPRVGWGFKSPSTHFKRVIRFDIDPIHLARPGFGPYVATDRWFLRRSA